MRCIVVFAAIAILIASFPRAQAAAAAGVTVVEQPNPAADLAGVELLLQAGLDRQTPKQNGIAALVAEAILHTPVSAAPGARRATPLIDAINARGGSLTYVVEPRHIRFYLETLTGAFAPSLSMFQAAITKPDFSTATLAAARGSLNQKISDNQRLALSVGIDMLNRSFYQNSDAGMPPYGMPQTIAGFTPADVQAFYAAHYRRGDAVISAIGNIAGTGTTASDLADGLPAGTSSPVTVRMPNLPSTSKQIIARRDVPVPWLVAQYPAPDIRSKDFGAMLILTAFMQRTLGDVSEVPAIATRGAGQRGVGAFYNFDTYPANVIIYVDGGLGDPTRTFATALTVVNVLGHAKLGGDLSEMKTFAAGRFLEDTQSMQDRAWLSGIFASRHLSGNYLSLILKAIDSTTAADLQRVAARYLGAPTIALVLPRSQSPVQTP